MHDALSTHDRPEAFSPQERRLEALLDEALSPAWVRPPEGLDRRIAAATAPRLAAQRGTIGRIDPAALAAAALAAAVALAVLVGVWSNAAAPPAARKPVAVQRSTEPVDTSRDPVPSPRGLPSPPAPPAPNPTAALAAEMPQLQLRIAEVAAFEGAETTLDQEIALLAQQIEEAERREEEWAAVRTALDRTVSEWEFAVDLLNLDATF